MPLRDGRSFRSRGSVRVLGHWGVVILIVWLCPSVNINKCLLTTARDPTKDLSDSNYIVKVQFGEPMKSTGVTGDGWGVTEIGGSNMAAALKAQTWELSALLVAALQTVQRMSSPPQSLKLPNCTERRAWELTEFEGLLGCLFPESWWTEKSMRLSVSV